MTHLDPKFRECTACGYTLHHHTDPGWKCTQCGAENQAPARGASKEINVRAAVRETERLLNGIGVMEWIEKLADAYAELSDLVIDHYNTRMFDLLTDFGREIGMDLDHVDKARIAAGMIIGDGRDDGEPEPEPAPMPSDDERAPA